MEKLSKITPETDLQSVVSALKSQAKIFGQNSDYIKEYDEMNRKIRASQIGWAQKDKNIKNPKTGKTKEIVKAVRIPVPLQRKIVSTEVAFELGTEIVLTPEEESPLTAEIAEVWKSQRIFDHYTEAKRLQKSVCESAIVFKIVKNDSSKYKINKSKTSNNKLKFNTRLLSHENCKMYPYFDEYGSLKFFSYEIKQKLLDKTITKMFVYDDTHLVTITSDGDGLSYEQELHRFDRIPVLYLSNKKPSYFYVQDMIDRYEVSKSRLGGANDYSGQPILFTQGKITGMPDKNADGKHISSSIEIDPITEKEVRGDAKFLTHDNAPKSVEMEQKGLVNMILYMTATPNLSFENLKGLGAVSGYALEFMFTDTRIKASENAGKNMTEIERLINIILSGVLNAINTSSSFKQMAEDISYTISYKSIMPNASSENIDNVTKMYDSGLISLETAVGKLNNSLDQEKEVSILKSHEASKNPKTKE